jgi:hypothetical protein
MADDPNEIDPAIENLLNSLDQAPSSPEPDPEPGVVAPLPPLVLVQHTTPSPAPLLGVPILDDKPPDKTPVDKLIDRFDTVSQLILAKIEADRQQLETYINLYATHVQGDNPKTTFIEGLVSLQTVKSDTMANSIKVLDSLAKMVAASKSIVSGPGSSVALNDLDSILNASIDDDAP